MCSVCLSEGRLSGGEGAGASKSGAGESGSLIGDRVVIAHWEHVCTPNHNDKPNGWRAKPPSIVRATIDVAIAISDERRLHDPLRSAARSLAPVCLSVCAYAG